MSQQNAPKYENHVNYSSIFKEMTHISILTTTNIKQLNRKECHGNEYFLFFSTLFVF